MASAAEGGGRAGDDIPVYNRGQAAAISRRSFLAGGLAVAAVVGIVLNAVLPGRDEGFAAAPQDHGSLGRY